MKAIVSSLLPLQVNKIKKIYNILNFNDHNLLLKTTISNYNPWISSTEILGYRILELSYKHLSQHTNNCSFIHYIIALILLELKKLNAFNFFLFHYKTFFLYFLKISHKIDQKYQSLILHCTLLL